MADLNQVLKLKSDDATALMIRARLYILNKDMIRAQRDLDATPRSALTPYAQLELGVLYEQAYLFERAVAEYSRWIATYPKDPQVPTPLNAHSSTPPPSQHPPPKA